MLDRRRTPSHGELVKDVKSDATDSKAHKHVAIASMADCKHASMAD